MRTVVIGGGLTGLSAAYGLSDYDVILLEKEKDLGGLAGSYALHGSFIEKYYHHIFTGDACIQKLLKELGLLEKLEWRTGTTGYYIGGKIYRLNTPREILRFKHLSLLDKALLAKAVLHARRLKDPASFDDVPAAKWVLEKTNSSVYENFFEPLFKGKFGTSENISAAWLLSRIKLRSNRSLKGERLGYLRGGFQQLIEKMAEEIESRGCQLRTSCRVRDIHIANNKVEGVETDEGAVTCDNVIVTTPSLSKALSIDTIRYQGTICALFGMEKSLMKDLYWLNIKENVPFGAIIEHTNLIPRADYGENVFYVVSYVQDGDGTWSKSDKELVDLYLEGIARMFHDFHREDVRWWKVARNRFTAPIYELGYKHKILPYSAHVDGLYLAGMFSAPNYPERSMEGSIRAGFECAKEVMKGKSYRI